MSILFGLGITYITISVLSIAISTVEYFTSATLNKKIIREYRKTLKISVVILIIGIIAIGTVVYVDGIPQMIGW